MERKVQLIMYAIIQRRENVLQLINTQPSLTPEIVGQIIKQCTNESMPRVEAYIEVIHALSRATFREDYRMYPETFNNILQCIGRYYTPLIEHEVDRGKERISLEKALFVALSVMSTPNSYRTIGRQFGIPKSTVFVALQLIIFLINKFLCPKFLKWPSLEEQNEIAVAFLEKKGFPRILGAIDGCHIPIEKPVVDGNYYYNRKKFFSVVLQAICKDNMAFIDVDCRWPGSVHDARVLRTSPIYNNIHTLIGEDLFILGDSAYPCETWLLTPYRNNGHLTIQQLHYNNKLSKCRVIIENAFALLKGRFRRLKYLSRHHIQDTVETVVACCVLHNICIEEPDLEMFLEEGRNEVHLIHEGAEGEVGDGHNEIEERRRLFVDVLWNNFRH